MPPALHRHLKRGLDLGSVHTDPEGDAQAHEAKCRRIEAIATDYLLRGQPPLILSARLRGPFNSGWKNPWANPAKAKSIVRGRPARRRTSQLSTGRQLGSPETARAATNYTHSFRSLDQNADEVELDILPPTATSTPRDDASAATELVSADTESTMYPTSPPTNPFWLRRPDSERRGGVRFPLNSSKEASPTRSRSNRTKIQAPPVQKSLRGKIGSAKTPLHQQHRTSGASASTVICSPASACDALRATTNRRAQDTVDDQSVIEAPMACTLSNHSTQTLGASLQTQAGVDAGRPLHRLGFYEEPAHVQSTLLSAPPVSKDSEQVTQEECMVASSAPAMSTDFVYRKLSEQKNKSKDKQKSKARAVDFNSSPARKRLTPLVIESNEHDENSVEKREIPAQTASRKDCPKVALESIRDDAEETTCSNDTIVEEQPPPRDSGQSSHPSAMSTQAAMLLAQREFQESTYRTLSPANPWSQPSSETPHAILYEASPAITPLSVFTARLEHPFPGDSVLRGKPISTQDLFGAASPFAFSTIKKKPAAPSQSGLRFGLAVPHAYDCKGEYTTTKSPTPSAERVPLKAKDNTPSLWSFVNEKCPAPSQESLVDRSRRCVHDVELPQLGLEASPDGSQTNSGLDMTDRFLRNLGTN